MKLGNYFAVAFEALTLNKVRSMLTMLGIIIGVLAVIVMIGLGQASQAYVTTQVKGLGAGVLILTPGNPKTQRDFGPPGMYTVHTLKIEDARALETIPGVYLTAANALNQVNLQVGRNVAGGLVLGVESSFQEIRGLACAEGRFFTEQETATAARVIVVGAKLADKLFKGAFTSPLEAKVTIAGQRYRVIGVLAPQGGAIFGSADDQALVPIKAFQTHIANAERVNSIWVKAAREERLPVVQAQTRVVLRARHGIRPDEDDDFKIRTQGELLETVTAVTGAFTVLLAGIAAISLLVGGIGIMNIMLVSVTERTREIGVRKAVGAKTRDVLMQFLIESAAISLAGGMVGMVLGVAIVVGVTTAFGLPFVLSAEAVLGGFFFSAAVGVFFGLYPANKAARLDPVDALRYE